MSKKKKQSGSTREQLVIPGLEGKSYSAASEDSLRALGKNTYDPTWEELPQSAFLDRLDSQP